MLCVKRPLLLLLVVSAVWVPRSQAESNFSSCEDGVGNIFNATVVITSESLSGISGNGLSVGSEIAVYSSDPAYSDFCVGMMTWNGIVGSISIWGDDALTSVKDGLAADEGFKFAIYDAETGIQYDGVSVSASFLLGSSVYENDGVYVLSSLQISSGSATTTLSLPLREGWNLVGLDRDVPDADYRLLFPSSVENTLFSFDGNYILSPDAVLKKGTGYWLRMTSDGSAELEGLPLDTVSPVMRSGWNLISGPACSVPVTDIDDPSGILVENTLFSFDGSYAAATQVEQGKSYWLRTSAAGAITLACSQVASKQSASKRSASEQSGSIQSASKRSVSTPITSEIQQAAASESLTQFSTMNGYSGSAASASVFIKDDTNETILTIGVHPDASDNFESGFDLYAPPTPPVGAFDARSRVGSEDFLVDIRSNDPVEKVFTVLYQPEVNQGSIVLRWDRALLAAQGSFEIVDNVNGALFGPLDMTQVDSLDISIAGGILDSGLRILVRSSVMFPPDQPELFIPSDLAFDIATNTSLSWATADRADTYHIQVTKESDPTFDQIVFEELASNEVSVELEQLDVSTSYIWRIRAYNAAGFGTWSAARSFSTSAVQSTPTESEDELPGSITLEQNYPNPFNPTTTIAFEIPASEHVSLVVFDMTGRKVAELISRTFGTGRHEVRWDASGFSSGVYMYRLRAGAVVKTKTLLLMK